MTAPIINEIDLPFEVLVERKVRLRDTLKAADEAHKAKTAAAREYSEKLDGILLAKLLASGQESAKTKNGTVYISQRKSATIADGAAFRQFVITQQKFDMIDWRANATAVADFIAENEIQPPGINFSVTNTVGVRRK